MTARKAAKRLAELSSFYGSWSKGEGDPALVLATELTTLIETAYMANDRSSKGQKAYEKAKSLLRELAKARS